MAEQAALGGRGYRGAATEVRRLRYARKIDANLPQIRGAAVAAGFKVHTTNADWDLTVQMAGKTELWEVKNEDGKNKATKRQERLKELGIVIHTVRHVEDVIDARRRILGIATNPADAFEEWKRTEPQALT